MRALRAIVKAPNLYVKIPATDAGVDAIEDAVAEGHNINVTLIFALRRHAQVIEAYLRGLERFAKAGGDVRAVYYSVLALVVIWGVIALRLAQPIMLLQIGANIAGVVLTVASIHLLYINCRLLPPALRPPMWRRVLLVCMSFFYGCFAGMSLWSLL